MKVIDNFKNQLAKIKNHKKASDQKTPTSKSMLLQTYFTSLLCLVLSVTMFFGTSYAWFSSEVNNDGNEIYIGTLDVDLKKEIDAVEDGVQKKVWKSMKPGENAPKLFDRTTRWEPGYTALEFIQVVNEGQLAFKYEMAFTNGNLRKNDGTAFVTNEVSDVDQVAKLFDVWVCSGKYTVKTDMDDMDTSYKSQITEANGWSHIGTLDQLLNGTVVLSGKMPNPTGAADTDKTHTYTIAMHMDEGATAEVAMGKNVTLSVKLIAYQMTDETDDLGNQNYDSDIQVALDPNGLNDKLKTSEQVMLGTDVVIADVDERITMNGGILDGNKKTITYSGEKENGYSVGVLTTNGGTIRNVTISGNTNGRALYVTKLNSDLYVSNCVLSGAYSFNLNSSNTESAKYSLNFNDTVFKNWTSYNNVISSANFTDCTFEEVLKPYGDTFLTNCSLEDGGLYIKELENGEKITLINCKYGNKEIKDLTITRAGTEYKFSAMGEEFVIDTTSDTTETILRWKTT